MLCTNGPSVSVLTDYTALRQGPFISVLINHTTLFSTEYGPSVSIHHLNPHSVFYIDNGSTQNTEARS